MNGTYRWTGQSVAEVVARWKLHGMQVAPAPGDRIAQAHFMVAALYPYRDYERSRQTGRLTPRQWDQLRASLRRGWRVSHPAFLVVGKDGCVVVGEGNHRLAIAYQLGALRARVPVHFQYRYQACRPQTRISRTPQRVA